MIPVALGVIELKIITVPIYRPQYPLREEQTLGIASTIEGLLEAGVLERTRFPWNSLINQVPTPGKSNYETI